MRRMRGYFPYLHIVQKIRDRHCDLCLPGECDKSEPVYIVEYADQPEGKPAADTTFAHEANGWRKRRYVCTHHLRKEKARLETGWRMVNAALEASLHGHEEWAKDQLEVASAFITTDYLAGE